MDQAKQKIKEFIIENFLFGEDSDLNDDTSFLEEEFEIEIDDEDMIPENLDSLKNLEKFIAKLLKTS